MKAQHHESLFTSRAAGDVTITKYKRGKVVSVITVAAGTADTARDWSGEKRGPKAGQTKSGAAANRFAESVNQWEE